MKYMMLINLGPKARDWRSLSEDEQKAIAAGYGAINQTPGVTPGNRLQPPETATTVRVQDGKTLTTDGPFVETKEALDGYFMFEADDLDAAIELAARIPAAGMGGAIEIRPIVRVVPELTTRTGLPRLLGSGPRCPDRLPRRLQARRGGRPGGVRHRRRALAARRGARPTPALGWSRPPATGRSTGSAASARWPPRPGCSTSPRRTEDADG